jgi:hypothetical protein
VPPEKGKIKNPLTFPLSNLMINIMNNCRKDTQRVRLPAISDKRLRGEKN